MKKIAFLLFLSLFSANAWAWDSETGSGVVSAQESIVRTSLEATQVLQSDVLTNLYGTTYLGGTTNSASFDSGGVLSFLNVVSSKDVVTISTDKYTAWLTSGLKLIRAGVSADNVYTIGANTRVQGTVSATDVGIASLFTTSINTTHVRVSGSATITSVYQTGTCSLTFNNGLLTAATC